MADAEKKSAPNLERKVVEYVPAGVSITPTRDEPTIDPELEKIRDAEAKANDVEIHPAPAEPTIDPELVKRRDEDIKRAQEYAAAADSDAVKAPAKKPSSDSKSSK